VLSNAIAISTLAAGVGAGAIIDMRTRRVPNELTGGLAAAGLLLAAFGVTGVTLASSFLGLLLGLALMLPGHVLGATGAGDVKLFAAAGTLMGAGPMLPAFLYTALAGGVIGVVVAVCRRRLKQTIGRTAELIATRGANAAEIDSPRSNNRFAYAPAIAIGVVLAAWRM
jgi:prepilin peptidase CpaA